MKGVCKHFRSATLTTTFAVLSISLDMARLGAEVLQEASNDL